MNERPPCRCLLGEIDQQQLAENIRELISFLPEEERTEEAEYDRRLELCRRCDALINGTCVRCGCYVEARAGRKSLHCPDVPSRW